MKGTAIVTEGETQTEMSCVCWFTPQITAKAGAMQAAARSLLQSPTWVHWSKHLAGSRMKTAAAGTRTCAHMGRPQVLILGACAQLVKSSEGLIMSLKLRKG